MAPPKDVPTPDSLLMQYSALIAMAKGLGRLERIREAIRADGRLPADVRSGLEYFLKRTARARRFR